MCVDVVWVVLQNGVQMVNDVLGGWVDLVMGLLLVEVDVLWVLMYWWVVLVDILYVFVCYGNVVVEVCVDLLVSVVDVVVVGVDLVRLVFDFGFGFVKMV